MAEVERFRVAYRAKFRRQLLARQPRLLRPLRYDTIQEYPDLMLVGRWKPEAQLKAPPDRTVEKLGVVRGRNHDDVARQLIQLHQQERDDTLDLAGLVRIAALLTYRIELIEEQDARPGPNIVKEFSQSGVRLAEIAPNERIIPNDEKRQPQRLRNRLGEGGLAVPRWAREQDPVTRFVAVRAQYIRSDVLLDKLPTVLLDRQRKEELAHLSTRLDFQDRVFAGSDKICCCGKRWRRHGNRRHRLFEAVGHDVVLQSPLFCHQSLSGRAQHLPIAGRAGAYEGNEEITAGHDFEGSAVPPSINRVSENLT